MGGGPGAMPPLPPSGGGPADWDAFMPGGGGMGGPPMLDEQQAAAERGASLLLLDDSAPPAAEPEPSHVGNRNCFLAVFFQALWFLEPVRSAVSILPRGNDPILAGVQMLLSSLFDQRTAAPLAVLRAAFPPRLAEQARAQIGSVGDASEAFEAALSLLADSSDPRLVSVIDANFRLSLIEMCECTCGELLEPISYKQLASYVSVPMLLSSPVAPGTSALTAQLSSLQGPECPVANCSARMQIQRYLMLPMPQVLTVALVWDAPPSEASAVGDIATVLQRIELQIDVQRAFKGVTQPTTATLRGMMCQHGSRYCAFFYDGVQRTWQWFDDSTVQPVGDDWATVASKCSLSHYVPSFLFYAVHVSS